MLSSKTSFLLLVLLLSFSGVFAQQENATEIVRQMDQKMRGLSSKSEMTMKVVRPKWQRTMSLKNWAKGTDYSLVLVTAPAKDKGTVSLKRENELWNWLPAIERSIKVSPSMMMQSWMGSDFTNDDLLRESSLVNDYTHKFAGSETLNGRDNWIIEFAPKPEAPVVWGKIKGWVSKDEYLQMKVEYYDEDGDLVSSMIGSDVKEMDGRLLPSRYEMVPADKEGHKTIMVYNSLDFGVELDESFFSLQRMRTIR